MRQQLHLASTLNGNVWQYSNLASENRRHTHAELELNLITAGIGTYLLGNRRYQVRRGDLLWLFPQQEHVLIEQSPDFQMWIAVFRRRAVRHAATDLASRPLLRGVAGRETCKRLTSKDMVQLETLLTALAASDTQPDLLNAGLSYALLLAWRLFQRAGDVPVRDLHPAVERAARLIHNGSAARSLAQISHGAGLSPARLSRLFKAQTGFAISEFRNRRRLELFLEIYGTGQRRTILDAALEAGFGSYPQFHRTYRRLVGSSPGELRRRGSV